MNEDMATFFAKRSTPENKEAKKQKENLEKEKEEFYKDAEDFVRTKLNKIPDWEDNFTNENFAFRIDKNPVFKNILSQFIDFKKKRWGSKDPLNLNKTFAEGDLIKKIIKEIKKEELKKTKEIEKESAKKEKYTDPSRVDIRFGKPRFE